MNNGITGQNEDLGATDSVNRKGTVHVYTQVNPLDKCLFRITVYFSSDYTLKYKTPSGHAVA
jgi:hypothetical protein